MHVPAQIPTSQSQLLQAKHLDLKTYLEFQACSPYHHQLLPLLLLIGACRVMHRSV
jgi:hypothetical protein